jgi:hypothetical protein
MAERLAALVVLIAGGVYVVLALPYPRGVAAKPGAGFFPLIVGAVMIVAGIGFVYEAFRRAPERTGWSDVPFAGRVRVLATAGILAVFCLALPWIGYAAATFAFVTVMLRALDGSWRLTLTTAVVSAGLSYYVFATLLQVPLPKGVWLD